MWNWLDHNPTMIQAWPIATDRCLSTIPHALQEKAENFPANLKIQKLHCPQKVRMKQNQVLFHKKCICREMYFSTVDNAFGVWKVTSVGRVVGWHLRFVFFSSVPARPTSETVLAKLLGEKGRSTGKARSPFDLVLAKFPRVNLGHSTELVKVKAFLVMEGARLCGTQLS